MPPPAQGGVGRPGSTARPSRFESRDKVFNYVLAAEAAEVLGLSVHQLYRQMHQGEIPYVYYGRNYLIRKVDLEECRRKDPLFRPGKKQETVSVLEAAQMTHLNQATVRGLCVNGTFRYRKTSGKGARFHIEVDSVTKFMALYMDML